MARGCEKRDQFRKFQMNEMFLNTTIIACSNKLTISDNFRLWLVARMHYAASISVLILSRRLDYGPEHRIFLPIGVFDLQV